MEEHVALSEEISEADIGTARIHKPEALLLALVLVVAFHAVPYWGFALLPARDLYEALGHNNYYLAWHGATAVVPLLLCLGSAKRSGFCIGSWDGNAWRVLGICALPVFLTATIYPFTSQPFKSSTASMWLISPLAQDLLFTGYLFGLFESAFRGTVGRVRIQKAVIITAAFFSLWHIPNFGGINATYVLFQLLYTFIGGAWILIARQLTGSILPGIATHMAINFVAWKGW